MGLRTRGILALARTLEKSKKWLIADVPGIQRRFLHENENFIADVPTKTGFDALGVSWTIEPLSEVSSSGLSIVRVSCGSTVVLARIQASEGDNRVSSTHPWRRSRDANVAVEYKEHYHAVGKFPPVFDRREMMITARERRISNQIQDIMECMIVPESGSLKDISIKLSVLSAHEDCDSEIVAMNAASAALAISPQIPWYGPVGAVRIQFKKDGDKEVKCLAGLRALYTKDGVDDDNSAMGSMLVVCSNNGILQASGDATDLHPKYIKKGICVAQKTIQDSLLGYQAAYGRTKTDIGTHRQVVVPGADPAAARRILDNVDTLVTAYLEQSHPKSLRGLDDYVQSTLMPSIKDFCSNQGRWRSSNSRIKGSGCVTIDDVAYVTSASIGKNIRNMFWDSGRRPDGRGFHDILPDSVEMGHLPSCHGSSMYSAGATSITTAVTCGSLSEVSNTEHTIFGSQLNRVSSSCSSHQNKGRGKIINSDDLNISEYVSSTFARLIPSREDVPFSFRISAEIIASDSCTVSSCLNGATLAMQNLGMRLRHPLGAATVGLACKYPKGSLDGEEQSFPINDAGVCEKQHTGDYQLIVDPCGIESTILDATLVSSGNGLVMSSWIYKCNKKAYIPLEMVNDMIDAGIKSQKSRLKSLASLQKGPHHQKAKFGRLSVHPATLPKLQSDRRAILDDIEAQTGGKIHVGEDGLLSLFAPSPSQYENLEDAVVQAAGANLVPGRVYKARVTTIKDFGAFVELPGSDIEALLHISEISAKRIVSVEDEISLYQELDVLFQGRDKMGNLRVSLKGATNKNRKTNE